MIRFLVLTALLIASVGLSSCASSGKVTPDPAQVPPSTWRDAQLRAYDGVDEVVLRELRERAQQRYNELRFDEGKSLRSLWHALDERQRAEASAERDRLSKIYEAERADR